MIGLWIPVLWLSACFLLLFAIAELLYRFANIKAEYTRKLVHAGTGLLTLLFPIFLKVDWQVAILCGSFLLLLISSMYMGWLPSINAVERRTAGSWLYPVVVFLCFVYARYTASDPTCLFRPYYYFYLPLLLLAICDPLAALAGSAWRRARPTTPPGKTFAGSFTFLGIACLIAVGLALFFTRHMLPSNYFVATGMVTAIAATVAERFSDGGWDNFTIPMAAVLCMWVVDYAL